MTSIDELARRAAAATRAQVDADVDIERGLARVLEDEGLDLHVGSNRRRYVVASAAALIVAVTVGIGIVLRTADGSQPSSPSIVPTTVPIVTGPPTTTASTPTIATSPPTTTGSTSTIATSPPTTTATTPQGSDGLTVTYTAPPPLLTPTPFFSGETFFAAISPDGTTIAIDASGAATLISPDGTTSVVDLEVMPTHLVAGPSGVLYGLHYATDGPDPAAPEASIVAIASTGERSGQVIAEAPVDRNTYLESPVGIFGSGPAGIIDRFTGQLLIGWVDPSGQPMTWPTPPPAPARITVDDATDVITSSAGTSWPLRIERHPDWRGTDYVGESPPGPTADGGAVLWTSLGPPADDSDYPPPTMGVIAQLRPDGTATWHRLPDDWHVLYSDIGGTLLAHTDDVGITRLARLDQTPP
jgi:hypothetical protein